MYNNPNHDRTWCPHSISVVKAISMGAEHLQQLVNERQAVVVAGSPAFTQFDSEQLSILMKGDVRCYGKLSDSE